MLGRFIFFFSSRRRHTRFDCDWSSDVCSSDLDRRAGREHEGVQEAFGPAVRQPRYEVRRRRGDQDEVGRSEEHTSELQSQSNLVCRLLLEKKKKKKKRPPLSSRLHQCNIVNTR